jgi:hypothetical protein
MALLEQAMRGALQRPPAPGGVRRALVVGAGGALGTAVVERLLADGLFAQVAALVEQPLRAAPRRLAGVGAGALARAQCDTAIVVYDRPRGRHGREDVFARPEPAELPELGRALHAGGVRRLVVVLPHAPTLLPQALKVGLASLDEQALAAAGFEHLVFVRSARRPGAAPAGAAVPWLQRVADGLLAQLHWMVPLRDQPVRAEKVAAFVAALARALPDAPPGTRVAPPELVWQAAQPGDIDALVARGLVDGTVPLARLPRQRW